MLDKLRNGLAPELTYHCLSHTLDVLEQAQRIAAAEHVTCPEAILFLKIAALYHDAGYTLSDHDHELLGCNIAEQELPGFGLSPDQIETICGMIRATKIPQSPRTHLEQILCDADLDYMGRDDFKVIANNLYLELKRCNKIREEDEWSALQIQFMEKHQYFTRYAQENREKYKQANLQELKTTIRLAH